MRAVSATSSFHYFWCGVNISHNLPGLEHLFFFVLLGPSWTMNSLRPLRWKGPTAVATAAGEAKKISSLKHPVRIGPDAYKAEVGRRRRKWVNQSRIDSASKMLAKIRKKWKSRKHNLQDASVQKTFWGLATTLVLCSAT